MTIPQPTTLRNQSPVLRALAIGLAFLGLCVFAWGLKYKLSLYDPPHSISRHMPAAKLLAGNERRALPLVDPGPAGSGALAFLAVLLFTLPFLKRVIVTPALAYICSVPSLRRPVATAAPCAANFIRPPPQFS